MRNHRPWMLLIVLLYFFAVAALSNCTAAAGDANGVRQVGKIKIRKLSETSGIAASRKNPDILWVHNDGKSQLVFAVHTSGMLAALVGFPVEVEDFEDIAIGPGPEAGADYLYVGDIGDNDKRRREIRVVRFAEPQMSEARGAQIEVESAEEFRFTYPDGAHNAEALIVDPVSGDLFIVTKERKAQLFTCPVGRLKDKAVVMLESRGILDIHHVSGGAIARDGSQIIVRCEETGWLWNRSRGQSVADALRTLPQEIPVRDVGQGPNGEAVSFSSDGRSYYTVSEGKQPVICEFQLSASTIIPSR